MTLFQEMQRDIEGLRSKIEAVNWSNENSYAIWLSQAYYIAKQSTSFLGLCLIQNTTNPEFHKRCTKHIAEEAGHENLILNDLKKLGLEKPLPELPETCLVYQTQYYRIAVESPMSFLGYVFLLELLAPAYGPYLMENIKNKSSLSFLKVHTGADEHHIDEAIEQLEMIKDEKTKSQILSNFKSSLAAYSALLSKIVEIS